jgi:hypothetical protein
VSPSALARFQGITTRETIDLMSMAVNGDVGATDAFSLMSLMADHDRGLRLPKTASDFTK